MKNVILILIAVLGLTFGSFAQNKPFSNPALIYGSSFGSYFQILHKQGDFKTLLKFTSSECIKKNGKNKVLKEFENMKFDYEIKLINKIENSDGTITLNYKKPGVMTEKGILRMVVKIENDTVKFVSSNAFLK